MEHRSTYEGLEPSTFRYLDFMFESLGGGRATIAPARSKCFDEDVNGMLLYVHQDF
jgi:hypothetical protein